MNPIIEKIFETETVVGRSGKIHPLRGGIDRQEGEFLYKIIQDDPAIHKTLEIGCACGISSMYICAATKNRPNASHTIIDPNQTVKWDAIGITNLETSGFVHFKLIELKSEFALPRLLQEQEGPFDFIFIDGWHTFDHTLLDCFYATRLLRVGGILAIDDVNYPAIKRVIEFIKTYPCYKEHGAIGKVRKKNWKRNARRLLLAPFPQRTWARILHPSRYRKIFHDRVERMVALKKIKEDERSWDWHDDGF